MSRIDRMMVSLRWLQMWPNTAQFFLQRSFSDHCPIILCHKKIEWEPKPFRIFNAWINELGFLDFVKKVYGNLEVQG